MRELEQLPEQVRKTFERNLSIGDKFRHKYSQRTWQIHQIHRKDAIVELKGPGVEKKISVSFNDLKRSWEKLDD